MKNAKVGLAIGILLLIVLSFYFFADSKKGPDSFLRKTFVASSSQAEKPALSEPHTSEVPDAESSVSPEFKAWVEASADKLNQSVESQEQTEELLKTRSAALSFEESGYLARLALQSSAPANSRIFSVYLLGLEAVHNFSAISAVLEAPLSFQEKPATHSPEETLAMQEKSLRRMAIEELLKSYQKGDLPREKAAATFEKIPDAQLKKYALTRLAELTK
ncbi:hypothetical protein [Bdellovibrio bacteriovorus]|uniref:hypothetical protein n=1 Tax=Bdellovibrio bacteriovorus TaxID=959 RepID=UPI0035A6581B